jgi:hypothetical protein
MNLHCYGSNELFYRFFYVSLTFFLNRKLQRIKKEKIMKICGVQKFSWNRFQCYFLLELRTWYKYSNMVVICKIEASLNTKVSILSSYNLHLNNQTMLKFWEQHINILYITRCQSQWPHDLRHEMSLPTEKLDCGFESHLRHGCLYGFILCLCVGSSLALV